MEKQKRPVFLNLWQIRFPITAIMSILHRLTGVLLFLAIPFFIYALQASLYSESGFQTVIHYADSALIKITLLFLTWSLLHHLLAGVRYLLLDIDLGIERQQAKLTAWLVIILALGLLLVFAGACL